MGRSCRSRGDERLGMLPSLQRNTGEATIWMGPPILGSTTEATTHEIVFGLSTEAPAHSLNTHCPAGPALPRDSCRVPHVFDGLRKKLAPEPFQSAPLTHSETLTPFRK